MSALWVPGWASMAISAAVVLAFNWFFVPPKFTLTVDLPQNTLLLVALLLVNWIIAGLTVRFHDVPWVPMERRVNVQPLGHGFWQVQVNYGFMNTPDVPKALELTASHGLTVPLFHTSYFLSRETVVPTPGSGMANWREKLFATMSQNAGDVAEFFRLPSNAVVELGTRVTI